MKITVFKSDFRVVNKNAASFNSEAIHSRSKLTWIVGQFDSHQEHNRILLTNNQTGA
jgi:hypothetical protein